MSSFEQTPKTGVSPCPFALHRNWRRFSSFEQLISSKEINERCQYLRKHEREKKIIVK